MFVFILSLLPYVYFYISIICIHTHHMAHISGNFTSSSRNVICNLEIKNKISAFIYTCHLYICIYIYIYIYIYNCIHIDISVRLTVFTHIYIYIHTYIHIHIQLRI